MSKLGFIKNYFSSLVRLALKLTPILVITFLILSVQNGTMKLTIDNIRYPKIGFNHRPCSIPQISNAKISSPSRTKTYIPQPNNKRFEIQWAKAYFPYLTLCHSIGLWNFIYLFTTTIVIGVWDLYRNIAIPGGKRVEYIPKWK